MAHGHGNRLGDNVKDPIALLGDVGKGRCQQVLEALPDRSPHGVIRATEISVDRPRRHAELAGEDTDSLPAIAGIDDAAQIGDRSTRAHPLSARVRASEAAAAREGTRTAAGREVPTALESTGGQSFGQLCQSHSSPRSNVNHAHSRVNPTDVRGWCRIRYAVPPEREPRLAGRAWATIGAAIRAAACHSAAQPPPRHGRQPPHPKSSTATLTGRGRRR